VAAGELFVRRRQIIKKRKERDTMAKKKLECNECGGKMRIDTGGITVVGGGPGTPSIVKLRCDKCNINRREKRSDIERELAESGEIWPGSR
jgi:hypothetical protein